MITTPLHSDVSDEDMFVVDELSNSVSSLDRTGWNNVSVKRPPSFSPENKKGWLRLGAETMFVWQSCPWELRQFTQLWGCVVSPLENWKGRRKLSWPRHLTLVQKCRIIVLFSNTMLVENLHTTECWIKTSFICVNCVGSHSAVYAGCRLYMRW